MKAKQTKLWPRLPTEPLGRKWKTRKVKLPVWGWSCAILSDSAGDIIRTKSNRNTILIKIVEKTFEDPSILFPLWLLGKAIWGQYNIYPSPIVLYWSMELHLAIREKICQRCVPKESRSQLRSFEENVWEQNLR